MAATRPTIDSVGKEVEEMREVIGRLSRQVNDLSSLMGELSHKLHDVVSDTKTLIQRMEMLKTQQSSQAHLGRYE